MRKAIRLDVSKPRELDSIRLRQGEYGHLELVFKVADSGLDLDLSAYDGVDFIGACEGHEVVEPCTVGDDGAVLVVTGNMTARAGVYSLAYLELYTEETSITTQVMSVEVLEGVTE